MALRKFERRNYGGKWPVSIKYQNLHTFKEGLIILCQSILETRRITHLHGSAHFTIPLILWKKCSNKYVLLRVPFKSCILRVPSSFWGSFLAYVSYVRVLSTKARFPVPGLTPDFHAIFHVISVFNTSEDVPNNWLQKSLKFSGKGLW